MSRYKAPTPTAIRKARLALGMTQSQAAALIHRKLRAWQNYELGARPIDQGGWELWQLKAAELQGVRS
jgi:hypothetical protein